MNNVFADFLQEAGLYGKIEITSANINELIDLIGGKVRFSSYCTECKDNRTFSMNPIPFIFHDGHGEKSLESLADHLDQWQKTQSLIKTPQPDKRNSHNENLEWTWSTWQYSEATRLIHFPFVCSMDATHTLDYIVLTRGNTMIKIGQYPSVADLAFPELKEYKKVVSADDLRELRKAIGLHAQGIGIGAFVYVRRIFERLIDRAKDMAITGGSLDVEEYSRSHVAERIDLLKKYLPNTLVSNKAFYGIVSKGIHELSEEDCIAYFPVVQEGIMLILRQWKAKQEEIETEQRLSASLSKIATNLSKGGNN